MSKEWKKEGKKIKAKNENISQETLEKYKKLKEILSGMKKVLVAFSGGVDSTFLLKVAQETLRKNVLAVIASSETYPQREQQEAVRLAQELDVRYMVIHTEELDNPEFASNPPQRCYFCKKELFAKLNDIARAEEIPVVLDGANYEDTSDFRPGTRAAEEFGVRSPLKEAGFLKGEIRQISKELKLPTWNKPSLACLSSRFPYYTEISHKNLTQVAQAEEILRDLGFRQIRVRHHNQIARIEIEQEEFPKITKKNLREKIVKEFNKLGYVYITIDLAGYRTGSMNEPLMGDIPHNDTQDKK